MVISFTIIGHSTFYYFTRKQYNHHEHKVDVVFNIFAKPAVTFAFSRLPMFSRCSTGRLAQGHHNLDLSWMTRQTWAFHCVDITTGTKHVTELDFNMVLNINKNTSASVSCSLSFQKLVIFYSYDAVICSTFAYKVIT